MYDTMNGARGAMKEIAELFIKEEIKAMRSHVL